MSEWRETEFGTIPAKWKYVKGTEYCSKVTDGTHDSPKQVLQGRFLITSKHIKGRDIDFENAYLISEEDYKKIIERSHVDQWDVIISMIGEYCGFTYIERNPNPNYAVKNVGMFKTGSEHRAKWLHYYLNSKIGKAVLEAQKTGTSQPYITLGSLRNLEVLLPNNEDDLIAIAEVLSSLDDKIDLLHRNNKTLEQMAETLFRQWFVVEAKEEWETVKLGSLAVVTRGLSYKGSGLTDSLDPTAIPMINLNSINEGGGFKHEGLKFYNGSYNERHMLSQDEIALINTDITQDNRVIGWAAILPEYITKAIYSHHIYKIRITDTRVTKVYLLYTLNNDLYRDVLVGATNGTTVSMLPIEALNSLSINIPPVNLLIAFEKQVSEILCKIERNNVHIRTLIKTRDTLLPKLMSGQVRVEQK